MRKGGEEKGSMEQKEHPQRSREVVISIQNNPRHSSFASPTLKKMRDTCVEARLSQITSTRRP